MNATLLKSRLVLLMVLVLCRPAASQTPHKSGGNTVKPPTPHAEWRPDVEKIVGLTQQQFNNAGLSKLTESEYEVLLDVMAAQQVNAGEEAKKKQVKYVCGTSTNYDKVRIVVDSGNSTSPPEIISGLRQRLRAMTDIEIVFDELQADFGVIVLSMETHNKAQYQTGYTASVITYSGCQGIMGDYKWSFKKMDNSWILTATSASEVVDTIVSDIDANDIEQTRRLHAALKGPQPKP